MASTMKGALAPRSTKFALVALVLGALATGAARAGSFGVSPIRLDLDPENKTAGITIANDDQERSLEVQAKLFEWTQDAEGKDVYTESGDLVFFPRIFSVDRGDQRVIRVGLRAPALATEKAYRLFIEELPPPRDPRQKGAQVAFVLRFGVPIFLTPSQKKVAGGIDRIESGPDRISVVVVNSGSQHFRIESLKVASDAAFEKEIVGGYVLAGVSKRITIDLPREACKTLGRLHVFVKTDAAGEFRRATDWDGSHCGAH